MILELDSLLAPLAEDQPCGHDLSFSALFDEIAEARREDDPTLDQGDWVATLKAADWPLVVDRAARTLATQSKDLRIAGWLVEALAKTESFAGLAVGFDFIERLCERYWPALHPQLDGDDTEARAGIFNWLIDRIASVVRQLPLTSNARLAVSFNDWQAAQALRLAIEREPDEAARLAHGRITLADISAAVEKSGDDFYRQLLPEQLASKAAAERLAQRIDGFLGVDAPNFATMIRAIDEVRTLTRELALAAGLPLSEKAAPSHGADAPSEAVVSGGPLRTRAQALAQLRQVADFFRRTEPHSPVAYLADRAARWGDMPLHAWLRTVVKDEGALSHLEELLGVESPARDKDA